MSYATSYAVLLKIMIKARCFDGHSSVVFELCDIHPLLRAHRVRIKNKDKCSKLCFKETPARRSNIRRGYTTSTDSKKKYLFSGKSVNSKKTGTTPGYFITLSGLSFIYLHS